MYQNDIRQMAAMTP